ncbi:MAG: hypothetical protein PHI68_04575 [Candidatus Cloacimonetes bacterium]|nr:hypothetical protein [Candidatus Cloacimonadota bacterium]
MNNMLRVFALTAIILAISSIAIAQNSDQVSDEELSRMILDEIKAEGQQLDADLVETQEIIRRINELKFGKKVQDRIATLVEEKDEEGLRKEFDSYVQRLEGYFVTDVFRAETLLAEMNSLFGEVQFLQSELYYYSGALEYYKGDDTAAVRILDPFFELYPDSPVDAKALAIILRSLINSNQEARAERDYILMYPDINSSEIDYLSGHIYFNLGRDSEARAVFTKCSSDEIYGVDSELMIALIDALEQTPAEALEQFALLNDVVTNNPFVILALARIYILNSEWEKAEEQYQRYYDLMRTQRVDFSAYERVLSLLNSGRKDEANTLLNELIQKKEYGDYYTTLLFIWAELQTDQGKRLDAIAKLDEYVDSLADNINLIPSKLEVLNMIIHAKERLYADPSQENLDLILKDFDAIEADLNTIHTTLLANPGAMNLSTLEGLHKYEKNVIAQFRLYFEAYVKANNLRNIPDQVSIDVVEAIEETYVRAELAYQKVKDYLEAIESRDLQLQRRKEVDQNIAAYDRILNLIEQTLANPEAKVDRDAWQAYFQEYSEKKAEVLELAEYYDYDDTFDLIRQEIDLFYEDKANYDAFAEAAKYNYRVTKPAIIANREMGYVREEIDRITVIPPEYARLLNTFESSLAKIRQDIQITELHLAYKELDKKNKERFNKNLTYEEGSRELADIINQMRALSSEMEEFITQNPDYPGMMQPVGFGHLTGIANLYYILGEMQYVIAAGVDYDMQAYYAKALDYYRLSVEKDPQFYMKDAALYNVGFLSSYLKGREFDVRYDAFYEANPNALVRPDDLRISEEYYAEAIAAYTEIVENYPSSVLFDEAVYLLGMLYFNIGSDALETTQYYARARDYFNILIARPESKYEYDALYRRAETYSFSNDEESFIKATEDFIALINAIGEGKITDQTRIVEYTNFASQYIPYCIVATDGADFKSKARGAEIITRYVSSFRNREILYMILDEVISRKMLLNAPRQAIDFMEARLIIDPLTLENPTRLDSIRTAYYWYQNDLRDNEDINTIISEIDNKMIQLFGYNSDWYVANKDKDISAQLVFVKRAFDDIEARLLARFDTEPSSGNILAYQNHITNYASFKELHGTDFEEWYLTKKQNVVSLTNDLAERTGTTQNYVAAISGIHAFNDTYQQNPRFFVNEGLAHQYAKYILDTFGQESHVNPIIIDSLGNQVVSADTINAYTYYRQIASRYLNVLVSEQYSSEENIKLYASLLLNLADMEYNRNDAAQAQKDYAAILALSDDVANPFKRWIYLQMAYMAENEKNYSVAEDWYKKAIPYATDDKDREEIRQSSIAMINESRKKAEVDNDYMKLALESLRMAESFEATDKEKAEIFKMAAQKAYKDGKEYQKSIGLLMEVASDKKDVKVVYAFYYDAWTIADSLMTNKVLADSLKQSFIGKFPASNETFALRVQKLQDMAKNESTKAQAGEMYLELHDEVVA